LNRQYKPVNHSYDSYAQLGYLGVSSKATGLVNGEVLEAPGEVRIERVQDPDYPWLLTDLKTDETVKLCALIEAVTWIQRSRAKKQADAKVVDVHLSQGAS